MSNLLFFFNCRVSSQVLEELLNRYEQTHKSYLHKHLEKDRCLSLKESQRGEETLVRGFVEYRLFDLRFDLFGTKPKERFVSDNFIV